MKSWYGISMNCFDLFPLPFRKLLYYFPYFVYFKTGQLIPENTDFLLRKHGFKPYKTQENSIKYKTNPDTNLHLTGLCWAASRGAACWPVNGLLGRAFSADHCNNPCLKNNLLGKTVQSHEVAGGFFRHKYPFCFLGVFVST